MQQASQARKAGYWCYALFAVHSVEVDACDGSSRLTARPADRKTVGGYSTGKARIAY